MSSFSPRSSDWTLDYVSQTIGGYAGGLTHQALNRGAVAETWREITRRGKIPYGGR